jgi:hypothetical protein
LPKGKKAEGCKMNLQEDRVSRESFVANGTSREAWCFVTKSNAKVQEMLGLEWHLWIVIALRGFGTDLRRKFVLLDLMGFKSRWRFLTWGDFHPSHKGPIGFTSPISFGLSLLEVDLY